LLYEWLIDGNSFSTNENAGTIFTETNIPIGQTSSVHDLSLAVTDSRGCTDTITNLVTVSIPWAFPTFTFTGAGINSEGEFICPPIFGSYIDSSISYGAINEWNWDFGNTNTSTLETPNNTYALPGVYSLTLSVVDEYGCTADTTLIDYVAIGGPSGEPAWVQIIGQCAQGANFTVVNAVNVDSTVWEMGDNNIIYDSVNFQYNYDEAGTYTPGVTLIDTGGCEVFYPLDPVTVIEDGLTAFYTATPNPAGQNEIITFTDGSVSVASTVVGWLWDFGNDSIFSLNSNNQFNSFPIAGDYSVSLTVTDALGCQDTYIGSIHIKDPEIWLPNVITTNNDGINELFIFFAIFGKGFSIHRTLFYRKIIWSDQDFCLSGF
jgi:PKD repeat protein